MSRDAEIQPEFHFLRHEIGEASIVLLGSAKIATRESRYGQSFERLRNARFDVQQPFRIGLDQLEVLLLKPETNHIHQRFFAAGVDGQNRVVRLYRCIEVPRKMQRHGLSEQRRLIFVVPREACIEASNCFVVML